MGGVRLHRGLRTQVEAPPRTRPVPPCCSYDLGAPSPQPARSASRICPANTSSSRDTTLGPRRAPARSGLTCLRHGLQTARFQRAFRQGFQPCPALVAQGIEHRSPKAGVAGSNPAGGTNPFPQVRQHSAAPIGPGDSRTFTGSCRGGSGRKKKDSGRFRVLASSRNCRRVGVPSSNIQLRRSPSRTSMASASSASRNPLSRRAHSNTAPVIGAAELRFGVSFGAESNSVSSASEKLSYPSFTRIASPPPDSSWSTADKQSRPRHRLKAGIPDGVRLSPLAQARLGRDAGPAMGPRVHQGTGSSAPRPEPGRCSQLTYALLLLALSCANPGERCLSAGTGANDKGP